MLNWPIGYNNQTLKATLLYLFLVLLGAGAGTFLFNDVGYQPLKNENKYLQQENDSLRIVSKNAIEESQKNFDLAMQNIEHSSEMFSMLKEVVNNKQFRNEVNKKIQELPETVDYNRTFTDTSVRNYWSRELRKAYQDTRSRR